MHFKLWPYFILLVIPTLSYSGECEKNTARQSVICLEKKIDHLSSNINNLVATIQKIKDSNQTITKTPLEIVPIAGIPDPKISATDTSNSIQFDVVSCRHQKLGAKCEILITSNRDDTDIFIYNNSRAFNENGGEYKVGKITIANYSGNLSSEKYIKHRLIEGVPVKADLIFNKIPKDSTRITAIDIYGFRDRNATYDKYRIHAKLRNVVLLR